MVPRTRTVSWANAGPARQTANRPATVRVRRRTKRMAILPPASPPTLQAPRSIHTVRDSAIARHCELTAVLEALAGLLGGELPCVSSCAVRLLSPVYLQSV